MSATPRVPMLPGSHDHRGSSRRIDERAGSRRVRWLVVLAFASLFLAACDLQVGDGPKASLTYTEDARAAYNEAMEAFRNKDWEEAKALFGEVKKLFPYTRYARLADLRIADADFEQEKYTEAIGAYRDFIQAHRNDPDVEYARYRVTKALFRDIDDSFLMPPQEERDQATAQEAYKELRGFLAETPHSRYTDDVQKMLASVTGRLVRHELFVARFYLKKDNFDATLARIDYALKTYPGSDLEAEALVLKGETLLKMKRDGDARAVFTTVIEQYGGPFAITARQFLSEMEQAPRAQPRK